MSIKQKAVTGVVWNSIGTFAQLIIEFIIGILLARILSPKEFGLIGMITVFIAISDMFINGGMSQALVQKKECSDTDYNTAFLFNLALGILFWILLFLIAPAIGYFYNESQLIWLIRILAFSLVISSLNLVQRSMIIRKLDFKNQSKVLILSSLISGIAAISCALNGWGVWSLVIKTITRDSTNLLLFNFINRWKPRFSFNKNSFQELFGFGSKLLASGLISTVLNNLNYIIIGKYFSAEQLGFYSRAEMFKNLPSQNVESILSGVAFPVLSKVQDDAQLLKSGFRRLLLSAVFAVSISLALVASMAEPFILSVIGEKWGQSIIYLQMLCMVGVFHPLNSINVNLLNVVGRSDLYLRSQTFMQILMIPIILIGGYFGIKTLILGLVFHALVGYFVYSKRSVQYSGYTVKEQLGDIWPIFILSLIIVFANLSFNSIVDFSSFIKMCFNLLVAAAIVSLAQAIFRFEYITYLTRVIFSNKNLTSI
jgi:teichuronic acid exporter